MRIAIVTESFEPAVNSATDSIRHLLPELAALGHDVVVVAPGRGPMVSAGFPVVRVPAMLVSAGHRSVTVGVPLTSRLESVLREFGADVVYLAAPWVLGAAGAYAARRLGVPSVAVVPNGLRYVARDSGLGWRRSAGWAWLRHVHAMADRTLAPSAAVRAELAARGVERLATWPRGVDLDQFHPGRRDAELRDLLGAQDRVLVGYVGRVAAERGIDQLPSVAALPGVRLVVVGAGPGEAWLRRRTPSAAHLGRRSGAALGAAMASLDVLVAPSGTSCQAVREGLAAGVPVVAAASPDLLALIQPGRNGAVVPPASRRETARAVGLLVRDVELRATLAAAARLSVLDRSWRAAAVALVAQLTEVSSGSASAIELDRLAA